MDEKNINKIDKQEQNITNKRTIGMEKINDQQAENISGGYRWWHRIPRIFGLYCDFCNKKIDGEDRIAVPILGDQHMCDKCFEKQKKILGADVANEKWLGFNNNIKRTESKVNITNKNINK